MRRFKQVKRKEVAFGMNEWAVVEKKAAECSLKTGTYIKRIAVSGQITCYNMKEAALVTNALRSISNNINQLAKKANEINSIYAEDIEVLRKENEEICRMLSQFLSTLPSIAALPTY